MVMQTFLSCVIKNIHDLLTASVQCHHEAFRSLVQIIIIQHATKSHVKYPKVD